MPPAIGIIGTSLTYSDKKEILAGALGLRAYNIDDVSDTHVFYEAYVPPESSTRVNFMRTYSIAKDPVTNGNNVTFGEAQRCFMRRVYEPLVVIGAFSLEDATAEFAGEEVLLTGKIFEAGEYPDKGFSITEEELPAAVAAFSPVPNDLNHTNTILDGKLGQLRSVVAKGKELMGTVAVPKWLKDSIGTDPLKVSLAWNTATKRIVGNALVLNPRIPDAQLMAAFSAANTTLKGGNSMKVKAQEAIDRVKAFFSKSGKPAELSDLDLDQVDFSADTPNPAPGTAAPAVAPAAVPAGNPGQFAATPDPKDTRIEALETELAGKSAAEFAENAIKAGKAYPAEREALAAQFKQARKDDSAGIACFADDGKPTTRVAQLQNAINARPSNGLSAEQIAGMGSGQTLTVLTGAAQFANDAEKPTAAGAKINPERIERLAEFSGIAKKEGQ